MRLFVDQVLNIRLRPSPREDIGRRGAKQRHVASWEAAMRETGTDIEFEPEGPSGAFLATVARRRWLDRSHQAGLLFVGWLTVTALAKANGRNAHGGFDDENRAWRRIIADKALILGGLSVAFTLVSLKRLFSDIVEESEASSLALERIALALDRHRASVTGTTA